MSSLKPVEKRCLEELLDRGGYVLDFTDATFGEFFESHNVDIHGSKYQTYGTSKMKKLRAFWQLESDVLVGTVLSEMLDYYEQCCLLSGEVIIKSILDKARSIVVRLTSRPVIPQSFKMEDEFLSSEFIIPHIQKLPIEEQVAWVIQARLKEVQVALKAGAYLSVIFLCGSILEAILLGVAQKNPATFNQAKTTPKAKDGSPKHFQNWTLAQLINVACEVGFLKPDIKTFSHGLRDFRNYIHPYEQMASGFMPDEHTARVCFQVLKAALASVAGER